MQHCNVFFQSELGSSVTIADRGLLRQSAPMPSHRGRGAGASAQPGGKGKVYRLFQCLAVPIVVFLAANWAFYGGEAPDMKSIEGKVEETYEDWSSGFNQISSLSVPVVASRRKAKLGRWTFSRSTCVVANETFLAVGMRVPKSASSTLQDLVEGLAAANRYTMSRVVQRHSTRHINRSEEENRLVEYLGALPRRTVHTAHVPFLRFGALGSPRPVYFATIREPFHRLTSHYEYEHFGPRPVYVKVVHQDTRVETFEECVAGHLSAQRAGRAKKKTGVFDCLQTAGLQVRYFCGISEFCRRTSAETLAVALANVERDFAAVVVVEEMLKSFLVLEAALPKLFRGLVVKYLEENEGGLRARANSASKASGGAISSEHRAFVMANANLRLEYGLYNFTVARLHAQERSCGIETEGGGAQKADLL